MSHRDSVVRRAGRLHASRPRPTRPRWRGWRTATAASTASSSTPRWPTRRAAPTSSATSCSTPARRRPTWTALQFIEEQVELIREQVGDEHVICALSGGVDSAVAALLVHRAVGDQLTCVFVDHGLLRMSEAEQVVEAFEEHFHVPLVHVEAADRFLSELAGVTDPEQKRRIIGEQFIRLFEDEARAIGDVKFLVQGTLYSDVIESGSRTAAKIKSHHNVGGLPEDMEFELVEPLRLHLQGRGAPGRRGARACPSGWCGASRSRARASRSASSARSPASGSTSCATPTPCCSRRSAGRASTATCGRASPCCPAIRSVGVQGDSRTYAYPIVIRAVTSEDAMTADWARLPYDLLERISSRIINEIPGVNRVALDISTKPPATIEWE